MPSGSVTRDDVAQRAGVSVATVSYVLNAGPKPVSEEKRLRVLQAVSELGYRPNAIARSLRARRTNILGLIVPDSANPYFARLARSIEEAAAERGYQVVVSNAAEDPAREAAQIEALLRLQVDGLLWVPADLSAGASGRPEGLPTVQVDRARPAREEDSKGAADVIESDNALGGKLAAEHLLRLGHRRIGFLSGPEGHLHTVERLRGARQALAERGLEPEVRHGDFGYYSGYEAGRAWMAAEGRPSAIICANDAMAVGVLCAAAEAGVRVPAELSVTGYDDIPQARYSVPPLTTVAQPLDEMAREAIDRLLLRVRPSGEAPAPVRRVYPVSLIERASTGPAGGLPE